MFFLFVFCVRVCVFFHVLDAACGTCLYPKPVFCVSSILFQAQHIKNASTLFFSLPTIRNDPVCLYDWLVSELKRI